MNDHFDTTLERKLESSADESEPGVSGVRRIELITGAERRRRWSDADKARIVVESLAPGTNVSGIARRNGLSPQQLFAWRREARLLFQGGGTADAVDAATAPQPPIRIERSNPGETDAKAPAFVPVAIASTAPPPPSSGPIASGAIEIAIGDVVVRVIGQIETAALAAVLRAVRRSA